MDDNTALWLLSALLQSMATVYSLFLIVYFYMFKNHILGKMDEISKKDIWYIYTIIWFNIKIVLAIICCILGLILFRNDILIYLAILFSIMAISTLAISSMALLYGHAKGLELAMAEQDKQKRNAKKKEQVTK